MIRDAYSKALIETDLVQLETYRKEKRRDKEISNLVKEIDSLKTCVASLKNAIEKIEAKL